MVNWFTASVTVKEGKPCRPRTWGYFTTKEKAIEDVETGAKFYAEGGYYTHVVIEAVPASDEPSVGPSHQRETLWYELDHKVGTSKAVDKPEILKNIVMFTLG